MQLDVTPFHAFAVIEINDAAWGFRKLGVVSADGQRYYDLLDDAVRAVAYPTFSVLEPKDVGDVSDWVLELVDHVSDDELGRIEACLKELQHKGLDLLTYLRAARWVVTQRKPDATTAQIVGREETARVRRTRSAQAAVAALV